MSPEDPTSGDLSQNRSKMPADEEAAASESEEAQAAPALPANLLDLLHASLDEASDHAAAHVDSADPLVRFGRQLRAWRIGQGYTRAQLAQQIGLDPAVLLAIEQGFASPFDLSPQQLAALRLLAADSGHADDSASQNPL